MKLLLFCAALAAAQAPQFEVAALKPSPKDAGARTPVRADPARVFFSGVTLKTLIRIAYRLPEWGVGGGPSWADSDPYDLSATIPEGATQQQVPEMIRALLAERCKLELEKQTREGSVYELTIAKNGPKLKPGQTGEQWDEQGGFKGGILPSHLMLHATTLGALGDFLSRQAGRPVLNKTNLTGLYDIDLKWSDKPKSTEPDLYTALQQQLGLKLTAAKAPIETYQIVHIEKPE